MATLLKADGTTEPITAPLTLRSMRKLVDGYIELLTIGGTPARRELLIVNEEGRLDARPPNVAATNLYRGDPPRHNGLIVGDAIHCIVVNAGQDSEAYE